MEPLLAIGIVYIIVLIIWIINVEYSVRRAVKRWNRLSRH